MLPCGGLFADELMKSVDCYFFIIRDAAKTAKQTHQH
jgi:hypothetical protein